jgi:exopolysaccharide biosynthesis polyprenyl glycosylphosphotransferase
MTNLRLRGLVNLHIAAACIAATGYFLVLALAVPYIPFLDLSPSVNLLEFAAPILVGMIVSARFWHALAPRYHRISWVDAAAVSMRQVVVVALMVFGLIVATKDRSVSRLFLAFYLVSCWVFLVLVNRWLPPKLSRLAFQRHHRVQSVFLGSSRAAERLSSWIRQKENLGIEIVGILSDEPAETIAPFLEWLGRKSQLAAIIEQKGIGQVILLEIPAAQEEASTIIETCQAAGCRLLIYQNVWERLPVPMVPVIEENHFFLTIHDEPLEDPFNRGIKRLYDMAVSLPVVLIILPPLCLLVWVIQRFQAPGPLFFCRSRGGQAGRTFPMWKFRSMYAATQDSDAESTQAIPSDKRIYPFGAFMRRTSIDEFPQFWNVLVGEMSIAGPRPHLPQHDIEFSMVAKTYRTRQLVKPGITGLAQVNGFRGEISDPNVLRQRVKLDVRYITSWSIWLDLQITVRTLLHVIHPPRSAY